MSSDIKWPHSLQSVPPPSAAVYRSKTGKYRNAAEGAIVVLDWKLPDVVRKPCGNLRLPQFSRKIGCGGRI